jgi:hypothetical protein
MTKKELPVDLLYENIEHIKEVYMKNDAELRKITSGDFKLKRWLANQQEFDARVKEFMEAYGYLSNDSSKA